MNAWVPFSVFLLASGIAIGYFSAVGKVQDQCNQFISLNYQEIGVDDVWSSKSASGYPVRLTTDLGQNSGNFSINGTLTGDSKKFQSGN